MADFTEITSESWFSRIGGAIKGVLFGLVLVVVAVVVLFWNEGRAVNRAKALKEGAHLVISVDAAKVDAANEGKLVHLTGPATTDETVADPVFGVSSPALMLKRQAEMFQWKERKQEKTEKNLGGSTTTQTTYNYEKVWSETLVQSSGFAHREGHENPTAMPYASQTQTAGKITVGAFTLSASLAGKINNFTPLPLVSTDKIPLPLRGKCQSSDGKFYLGANPAAPQIGDQRIAFAVVQPGPVSLVARQIGSTFEPYRTRNGGQLELLQVGTFTADEMFAHAREQNSLLTWGLRLGGWLGLLIGFTLIFKPLSVLADIVPFIGSLVGMGTGLLALLLATAIALVVIAIAWIIFRPLLGILLLAAAIAIPVALLKKRKSASPVVGTEPVKPA